MTDTRSRSVSIASTQSSGSVASDGSAPTQKQQWWALERRASKRHIWLLKGPMVLALWAYLFIMLVGVWQLWDAPITREKGSSIDGAWLAVLAPAMCIPTIVVWSFMNWLGWQFFRHN
jgi:hypothetical protein